MWNERLRLLRNLLHLTQKEIADKLGIKEATYRAYELKKAEPDFETLEKISEVTNTDLHWLITGEGNLFQKELLSYLKEIGIQTKEDVQGFLLMFGIEALEKFLISKKKKHNDKTR